MTPPATVINRSMAPRGNKGKTTMTIYVDPKTLREFKVICVSENKPMTLVIEEYIKKIVKEGKV